MAGHQFCGSAVNRIDLIGNLSERFPAGLQRRSKDVWLVAKPHCVEDVDAGDVDVGEVCRAACCRLVHIRDSHGKPLTQSSGDVLLIGRGLKVIDAANGLRVATTGIFQQLLRYILTCPAPVGPPRRDVPNCLPLKVGQRRVIHEAFHHAAGCFLGGHALPHQSEEPSEPSHAVNRVAKHVAGVEHSVPRFVIVRHALDCEEVPHPLPHRDSCLRLEFLEAAGDGDWR